MNTIVKFYDNSKNSFTRLKLEFSKCLNPIQLFQCKIEIWSVSWLETAGLLGDGTVLIIWLQSEWSSLIGPDHARYCPLIGPDQARYCPLIGPDQARYCPLIRWLIGGTLLSILVWCYAIKTHFVPFTVVMAITYNCFMHRKNLQIIGPLMP